MCMPSRVATSTGVLSPATMVTMPMTTDIPSAPATVLRELMSAVASGLYGSYREASENMTRVLTHYTPNADIHESYRPVYEIWDRCYRDLSRGTFDALYAYQKGLEE